MMSTLTIPTLKRSIRRTMRRGGLGRMMALMRQQRGATMLEWTLLGGCIALPSYFIMLSALNLLATYYQMMTVLNSLPFP